MSIALVTDGPARPKLTAPGRDVPLSAELTLWPPTPAISTATIGSYLVELYSKQP